MSVLRRTGAPEPPPVEELVCAFAHGSCACAGGGKGWCSSVTTAALRMRNRVEFEIAEAKRGRAA